MTTNKPDPAFGAHLEPFSGIPTFMRQPATRDLEGIDIAVVGVPFDSGTSYRSGTRFGPRKIRETSLLLWGFNAVLGVAPAKELKVVDYGDMEVVPVDIQATMEVITNEATTILAPIHSPSHWEVITRSRYPYYVLTQLNLDP